MSALFTFRPQSSGTEITRGIRYPANGAISVGGMTVRVLCSKPCETMLFATMMTNPLSPRDDFPLDVTDAERSSARASDFGDYAIVLVVLEQPVAGFGLTWGISGGRFGHLNDDLRCVWGSLDDDGGLVALPLLDGKWKSQVGFILDGEPWTLHASREGLRAERSGRR